uniref:FCH domain-containing protein n=1 Tax=Gasterosteus aculeatus TaxID=69293 RepID=G3NJA0_GASAC
MMTSHVKLRREKGSLAEYESQMKDLRAQLTDQIKILDSQVEVKQQQLSDLSEFLRRRGDIEAEYARALDKLTERFTHKTKKMERLMEKRHGRVQENQLKCTKARNDYLLNLAAANAAMNKYYLQDISTLIDCCDLGFHLSVERVMNYYLASRGRIQKTEEAGLKQLEAAVTSLDPGGDRDALLQQHD